MPDLSRFKKLRIFMLGNAVFFLYLIHGLVHYPDPFFSLVCDLLIFVVPGLSWAGLFYSPKEDLIAFIFCDLLLSTAILIFGIGSFSLFHIPVKPQVFLFYFVVVFNLGLIFSGSFALSRSAIPEKGSLLPALTVFLIIYSLVYAQAVYRIPAQNDSDIELQGTAYGLLHFGKPTMLTDRGTIYYFAHPLFIHVYSAFTILFTDTLDKVKYYYDFAGEGKKILDKPLEVGEEVAFAEKGGGKSSRRIVSVSDGKVAFDNLLPAYVEAAPDSFVAIDHPAQMSSDLVKKQKLWPLVRKEYEQFTASPELFATRLPHIFFSALSAVVLFMILHQMTQSILFSIAGPVLYFSFPEIVSLLSSELYTSISHFALLVCFYFYFEKYKNKNSRPSKSALLFLSAAYLSLVSHKTVILPMAVGMGYFLFKKKGETWKDKFSALATDEVVVGFAAGTAVFWTYGLLVDANVFITDHWQYHFWDRIFHVNELGYQGYPGPFEFWMQFSKSSGEVFMVISLVAIGFLLRGVRQDGDPKKILPLWFIVGAIVFSIVDWRENVHLSLLFPAMIISVFILLSEQKRPVQWLILAGLAYCFLRNIAQLFI